MCDNGPVNKEYEQVHRLSWDELEDTVISNLLRLLHLVSSFESREHLLQSLGVEEEKSKIYRVEGLPTGWFIPIRSVSSMSSRVETQRSGDPNK